MVFIFDTCLMRDQKEGRKKQARSNKQGKATQHTHVRVIQLVFFIFDIYMYTYNTPCALHPGSA